MKNLFTSLAALTILLTLTASQQALAQSTFNIPQQNRPAGSYGPFGPITLGANNEADVQFVSNNFTNPGRTFSLLIERSDDGGATWVFDFSDSWPTGVISPKTGQVFIPHITYDVPQGSLLRISYSVEGGMINLGATVTLSVKQN